MHARARAAGPAFLDGLHDLLRRTGWQDTEDLTRDVLGVDLEDPAFWRAAAACVEQWVDAFVAATVPGRR